MNIVSKKMVADRHGLISLLDRSASQLHKAKIEVSLTKHEKNPISGKNKPLSHSTVNITTERQPQNNYFTANGQLKYRESEFTDSEGEIEFRYDSFARKLVVVEEGTHFGSGFTDWLGKQYLKSKKWTLDLSYEKFFDEKGNPKNSDIAGPLLRRQLFIGETPIPDTMIWNLPSIIQKLFFTVKDPFNDFAHINPLSQNRVHLHVKNGCDTEVLFRKIEQEDFDIWTLEKFVQKRALKKTESVDFEKDLYEESILEAEIQSSN